MKRLILKNRYSLLTILLLVATIFSLESCTQSSGNANLQQPVQTLPVFTVSNVSATTYDQYPATVEGTQVIEVRPQVNGYLERMVVDEGAFVRKGQVLFIIDDNIYREQLHNAQANLATAKANLANAEIEVSKITPLVQNNVVSDVKLKAAQAAYDAATANVTQAEAMLGSASINLGYTTIKAPVDGYIGRIPYKTGSLVGVTMAEPLTVISEVKDVYAYFSFSEIDFLKFSARLSGSSLEEKLRAIPPVELVLADNSVYPFKGRIEIVSGQFNQSTGAISLRARFQNDNGVLRSGITGKIRIPHTIPSALLVPQESTFELQDKVLVFVLGENNTVSSRPIDVTDRYGNFYIVGNGLKVGQKIVYSGIGRLQDGAVINPELISTDSLFRMNNL